MIEAQSLYRFFHAGDDETLALQGVSLRVEQGETIAVTGPSGSGKSTLLSCLAGLDEPDGGMVRVGGERISRRPEEERARVRARRIGMLFQQTNLVGHLSVDHNVARAQRLGDGATGGAWRAEVLERCGIESRAHARPAQLSGGELARAGLAVALANDPPVILADEPTGELDEPAIGGPEVLRPGPVAVIFQGPSLLPPLTVAENVALPLVLGGATHSEGLGAAAAALERLHLAELADKLPEEISGGQAQRVAVARALAGEPRLVLADEPTGQLDQTSASEVVDVLLAAAAHSSAALVVATHDPAVAECLPERWHMHGGRLDADPARDAAWSL